MSDSRPEQHGRASAREKETNRLYQHSVIWIAFCSDGSCNSFVPFLALTESGSMQEQKRVPVQRVCKLHGDLSS
jgi:hypothetical protein